MTVWKSGHQLERATNKRSELLEGDGGHAIPLCPQNRGM